MTQFALQRATATVLSAVTWVIEPGVTHVLGTPEDGTNELLEVLGGARALRSGTVRIDGRDPRRVPAARRQLGVVFEEEAPFSATTVQGALEMALHAKGCHESPAATLDRLGLQTWLPRSCIALNGAERRTVALAVALAGVPVVLAIAEPYSALCVEPGIVERELRSAVQRGSIVVCVSRDPSVAARLGGGVIVLQRGRVMRQMPMATPSHLLPGAHAAFHVRCREARALAKQLLEERDVQTVHYDAAFPDLLYVVGADPNRTALAILKCARALRARLSSLVARPPSLDEVQAAAVGTVRAAYDHAYRAARQTTSAAPHAPNPAASPTQPGSAVSPTSSGPLGSEGPQ